MKTKHFREIQESRVLRERLVKLLVYHCVRNGGLENLHAGRFPSSRIGDYSDVKVVSPYGEIAWHDLSRLNDAEMRDLMIDVVNRCYSFLNMLFDTPEGERMIEHLKERDELPQWRSPAVR